MSKATKLIVNLTLVVALALGGVIYAEAAGEKQVFKFSIYYTETHSRTKFWREFCDRVAKVTNGEIVFKVFSGESLLKAKEEYEALIAGAIDLSGNAYITGYQPWVDYAQIPGYCKSLVQSMEIVRKIMHIGDRELDKVGIKLLWMQPAALISFYSNKGFVKKIDDFKGLKVRVGAGTIAKAFNSWGASTVTLSTAEQYTALQRGTVDATYVGTDSYVSWKLFEVAPYVTDFQHPMYLNPIMMNKKAWNKIPAHHQKKILEVGREFMDIWPERVMQEQDLINRDVLTHGGMLCGGSPKLSEDMVNRAKPLWKDYIKGAGDSSVEIYKIVFPGQPLP